jgi:hypothetical protein
MKRWNYSCLGETKLECQSLNPLVTSKIKLGWEANQNTKLFSSLCFPHRFVHKDIFVI